MQAANNEWFVVIKLFAGYPTCNPQPDAWHQYGPATAEISYVDVSYSISPGFQRADHNTPTLRRRTEEEFCTMVQNMVDSGLDWHYITTFNEHGEGTGVEASNDFPSNSGYGYFLDCLHNIH